MAILLLTLVSLSAARAQDGNVVYGEDAGASITTGDYHTFFGYHAGYGITSTHRNVYLGSQAGEATSLANDTILIGYRAGWQMSDGDDCVFIGTETGLYTTGDDNIFIGFQSGEEATTANENVFVGTDAGEEVTTAYDNVAVGYSAGRYIGIRSVAIGYYAGNGSSGVESVFNTSMGSNALRFAEGYHNTGLGAFAGYGCDVGYGNVFLGVYSGQNNDDAHFNTYIGALAGNYYNEYTSLDDSERNVAIGTLAAFYERLGNDNAIIGAASGICYFDETFLDESNWDMDLNSEEPNGTYTVAMDETDETQRRTILGAASVATGNDLVALGYGCSIDLTDSLESLVNTIVIGNTASAEHDDAFALGYGVTTRAANVMTLGNASLQRIDPHADATTALGSASYRFDTVVSAGYAITADTGAAAELLIDSDAATDSEDQWSLTADTGGDFKMASYAGSAWNDLFSLGADGNLVLANDLHLDSDARLKTDIQPLGDSLARIEKLQGHTYRWKSDKPRQHARHYGLIAQEVERVLPELVRTHPRSGLKTVNYLGMVPVLIGSMQELATEQSHHDKDVIAMAQENVRQLDELIKLQQEINALQNEHGYTH